MRIPWHFSTRGHPIAYVLLGAVFVLSIGYSMYRSHAAGQVRVVQITHWQLEPGFRDALQERIDAYNLRMQQQGRMVRVEQLPVPIDLYRQFINVHLLGGSAPDIIQVGAARLTNRWAPAFLMALDETLERPNPYAAEFADSVRLNMADRALHLGASWRETFINELADSRLQVDGRTYSISLSSAGTVRIFFNKELMERTKDLLYAALMAPQAPGWLAGLLAENPDETPVAVTRRNADLLRWAASPLPPQTFGQWILLCETLRVYTQRQGLEDVVAIAAQRHSIAQLADTYRAAFVYPWLERFDFDRDGVLTVYEIHAALDNGALRMDDPRLRAMFNVWQRQIHYFTRGWQGLERDHAIRSFLAGNALFLPAGSWDAGTILGTGEGVHGAAFRVGIMDPVVPGAGDRFGALEPVLPNEALVGGGLRFGVNAQSELTAEAIDFLQFLSSHAHNQALINSTGWLPIVAGVEPHPVMRPFMPRKEGVHPGVGIGFLSRSVDDALFRLFVGHISGELAFPSFQQRYLEVLRNPRLGIARQYADRREAMAAQQRLLDNSMHAIMFGRLLSGESTGPAAVEQMLLNASVPLLGGKRAELEWQLAGYDRELGAF